MLHLISFFVCCVCRAIMMLVVLKQNKQHIGLHSSLFLKFMISLSDVDILMYNQVQVM